MLHNLIKNDYYDSQINGIPNVDVILKMQTCLPVSLSAIMIS